VDRSSSLFLFGFGSSQAQGKISQFQQSGIAASDSIAIFPGPFAPVAFESETRSDPYLRRQVSRALSVAAFLFHVDLVSLPPRPLETLLHAATERVL